MQTVACGLCHSDLHVMDGKLPMPPPVLLGHEAAGIVTAVGSDVTEFGPGDHVIGCLNVHCNTCGQCTRGRTWLCERRRSLTFRADGTSRVRRGEQQVTQMSGLGGFAEEMLVHRNGIVKVTDDLPLELGALLGCAVITGVGSVFNGARIQAGSTVAVIGVGGVGLNIVQGARLAGAERIIAVDLNVEKLALATTFGATDVVNGRRDRCGRSRDRDDRRRRRRRVRGDRPVGHRRAGGADGAARLHRLPGRRAGARQTDRAARHGDGAPAPRPAGPVHGRQPLQARHPDAGQPLPAGPPDARRAGGRPHPLDDINAGFDAMRRATEARSVIVF